MTTYHYIMNDEAIRDFQTKEEAFGWMFDYVDDNCIDNSRFAFVDDAEAMAEYDRIAEDGCCGSSDFKVTIKGRPAIIGCNYGH